MVKSRACFVLVLCEVCSVAYPKTDEWKMWHIRNYHPLVFAQLLKASKIIIDLVRNVFKDDKV